MAVKTIIFIISFNLERQALGKQNVKSLKINFIFKYSKNNILLYLKC